jgi:hypothetical protein
LVRPARIEPATLPGEIFISEQFAALLAAQGRGEFDREYVGEIALSRSHCQQSAFRLRGRTEVTQC